MTTVTRPLSAGRITLSLSFFSRLRAFCSSLVKLMPCSDADCIVEAILLQVKLMPCSDADCIVEAILLLMLSLLDSDSSRCRKSTYLSVQNHQSPSELSRGRARMKCRGKNCKSKSYFYLNLVF